MKRPPKKTSATVYDFFVFKKRKEARDAISSLIKDYYPASNIYNWLRERVHRDPELCKYMIDVLQKEHYKLYIDITLFPNYDYFVLNPLTAYLTEKASEESLA